MKLYLAPMEGVVDFIMRDFLTAIGGIDHCVTEFVRITNQLLPDTVFYRYCPELKTNSKTRSGTPVSVQLLGGQPNSLAENAAFVCSLGASGIDLNFGCPAKTVNRHDGGATLLKYPDRIFNIVTAVRAAVPKQIPVSAKIRLGFDSPEICIENAQAVATAGASWLTVHCRTKTDMYKPPAYWEWIPKIKEKINIPVVANGDIWNKDDLNRCQKVTECNEFMIGRGALQDPFIFKKIKANSNTNIEDSLPLHSLLIKFFEANKNYTSPYYAQARTKQWLRNMTPNQPKIQNAFNQLKIITEPKIFEERLKGLHDYFI